MRLNSLLTTMTALAGALTPVAGAQVIQPWGDPAPRAVSLEVNRPSFDGGGTSALTTVNQLGIRWSVGSMILVGELPIVIAKPDGAPSGATLIGNPLLAIAANPSGEFIGELGVRIPVVSVTTPEKAFAQTVGLLADFVDFDAYLDDVLTIRGTMGYRHRSPEHFTWRVALRPTFMAPTGSNTGDSELFLDYGFQVGYETEQFTAGAMFNGRGIVTESGGSFGERTVHEIALGGSVIAGQWRPGLILRIPADGDLSNALEITVGLKLEVTF